MVAVSSSVRWIRLKVCCVTVLMDTHSLQTGEVVSREVNYFILFIVYLLTLHIISFTLFPETLQIKHRSTFAQNKHFVRSETFLIGSQLNNKCWTTAFAFDLQHWTVFQNVHLFMMNKEMMPRLMKHADIRKNKPQNLEQVIVYVTVRLL